MPLDLDVLIRKAAGATVLNPVLVLTTPGGGTERFPMTDANGDGTWTAHLDCAVAGTLKVEYTIKAADGSEQAFEIPVGKIVLIDPQGVVYDRAAYEAHRAAHPAASEDEARTATAIAGRDRAPAAVHGRQLGRRQRQRPGDRPERQPAGHGGERPVQVGRRRRHLSRARRARRASARRPRRPS